MRLAFSVETQLNSAFQAVVPLSAAQRVQQSEGPGAHGKRSSSVGRERSPRHRPQDPHNASHSGCTSRLHVTAVPMGDTRSHSRGQIQGHPEVNRCQEGDSVRPALT